MYIILSSTNKCVTFVSLSNLRQVEVNMT